jgi:hypothetical protein
MKRVKFPRFLWIALALAIPAMPIAALALHEVRHAALARAIDQSWTPAPVERCKAMDRIAAYIDGMDEAAFCASLIAYDAVLMNLIVIGEAANRLPREITATEQSIP